MRISVFTIFPEMLEEFLKYGLVQKAAAGGIFSVEVSDIRRFGEDARGSVDDSPFGGGPGMVILPEPVFKAVEAADPPRPLYILSPGGRKLDQALLGELSEGSGFSLICGRYEGIDERVALNLADGEISLGDFVLQGGEVAAMAIIEGVGRLLSGALGNQESIKEESFSDGLLEYPQYTRPDDFRGMKIPEILKSGNHQKIEKWRRANALLKTKTFRPDLIEARGGLSSEEEQLIEDLQAGKLDC